MTVYISLRGNGPPR